MSTVLPVADVKAARPSVERLEHEIERLWESCQELLELARAESRKADEAQARLDGAEDWSAGAQLERNAACYRLRCVSRMLLRAHVSLIPPSSPRYPAAGRVLEDIGRQELDDAVWRDAA